jgi:hypothetical protein
MHTVPGFTRLVIYADQGKYIDEQYERASGPANSGLVAMLSLRAASCGIT